MKLKLLQVKEAAGNYITNPGAIYEDMREEAKADRECFWVLHLNTQNRVIEKELAGMGAVNQAIAHPREVFRKAVLNSAVSIITVHNHPSGDLTPSEEDLDIWRRLKKSGDILDIKVFDHLIISGKGYFSAKEEGIL